MKSHLNIFIIILAIIILLSSSMSASATNDILKHPVKLDNPPDNFSLIIQNIKEVQLLRSDFLQHKNLKVLSRPFTSSGKMIYSQNKGLYWEINKPLQNAYLMNAEGIKRLNVASAESSTFSAAPFAKRISLIFNTILSGRIEALRNDFNIYYLSTQEGWTIRLNPINENLAKIIEHINIIGKKYIRQIQIHEMGGDFTDIIFTNLSEHPNTLSKKEARYFGD